MRWLWLHSRSRRALPALAAAAALVAAVWGLWLAYSDSQSTDVKVVGLTVMLAVAALTPTLGGADDSLDRTASVNWPARRAGHLLFAAAAVLGLLSLTAVVDSRFAPLALVLRNTAGLLGLTALGATLLGAARAWIAPLVWTLVTVMPWLDPGRGVTAQVAYWLIQPADSGAAIACATSLAVTGLLAYALRGCPWRPAAEVVLDH